MILSDFSCPDCGIFECLAPADVEAVCCPRCGSAAPWSPSAVHGRVALGEVVRGKVERPESPMFMDTRELGEGMPIGEWRAKRAKVYQERRHKEWKAGG